jgi:hypothetical protein
LKVDVGIHVRGKVGLHAAAPATTQRQAVGVRHGFDAGQRPHALFKLLEELQAQVRRRIAQLGQVDVHGQHAFGLEAQVHAH